MSVNVDVGPIDYLALEFPGARLTGEGLAILVDLVDRGIIRLLDMKALVRSDDGTVTAMAISDLDGDGTLDLAVFEGVESDLLDEDDLRRLPLWSNRERRRTSGLREHLGRPLRLGHARAGARSWEVVATRSRRLVPRRRIAVGRGDGGQASRGAAEAPTLARGPRRHRRRPTRRASAREPADPVARPQPERQPQAYEGALDGTHRWNGQDSCRRRDGHGGVEPGGCRASGRALGSERGAAAAGVRARTRAGTRAVCRPAATPQSTGVDLDKLKQLGELRDSGVLTRRSSRHRRRAFSPVITG